VWNKYNTRYDNDICIIITPIIITIIILGTVYNGVSLYYYHLCWAYIIVGILWYITNYVDKYSTTYNGITRDIMHTGCFF